MCKEKLFSTAHCKRQKGLLLEPQELDPPARKFSGNSQEGHLCLLSLTALLWAQLKSEFIPWSWSNQHREPQPALNRSLQQKSRKDELIIF